MVTPSKNRASKMAGPRSDQGSLRNHFVCSNSFLEPYARDRPSMTLTKPYFPATSVKKAPSVAFWSFTSVIFRTSQETSTQNPKRRQACNQ